MQFIDVVDLKYYIYFMNHYGIVFLYDATELSGFKEDIVSEHGSLVFLVFKMVIMST